MFRKLFISFLIFISLALLAMLLVLTPPAKKFAFEYLTNELRRQTGYQVSISDILFAFPLKVKATGIKISDEEKTWLEIQRAEIEVDPMELYIGHLAIDKLKLHHVRLSKPKMPAASSPIHLHRKPLPFFSPLIAIENIDMTQLQFIAENGAELPFINLNGTATANILTGRADGFINFNCNPLSAAELYGTLRCSYAENLLEGGLEAYYFKMPWISPSGEFKGHFRLDSNLSAFLEVTQKIEIAEAGLKGNIKSLCNIDGPLNAPILDLISEGDSFFLKETPLPNWNAKILSQYNAKEIKGEAFLNAAWNEQPLKASTLFSYDQKRQLSFKDIDLQLPQALIQGNLNFDHLNFLFAGNLTGEVTDLATPHGKLLGKSSFQIELQKDSPLTQQLLLEAHIRNLSYEELKMQEVVFSLQMSDLFNKPYGHFKTFAEKISNPHFEVSQASLETRIDQKQRSWPFSFQMSLSTPTEGDLYSSGEWHFSSEENFLEVHQCDGHLANIPFQLKDKLLLVSNKELLNLSRFAFDLGRGTVEGLLSANTNSVDGRFKFNQIPIELFHLNSSIYPMRGFIEGEANLFGNPAQVQGKIQFDVKDLIIEDSLQKFPQMTARVDLRLEPKNLTYQTQLQGIGDSAFIFEGKLPMQLSLSPFNLELPLDQELACHIATSGEIANIVEIFLPDISSLKGSCEIDLELTGTFQSPHLTGQALLKNGSIESLDLGAGLEQINALAIADGKTIYLKDFSAKDHAEGTLHGNGFVQIQPQLGFPFEIACQIHDLRLINLDLATGTVSGQLTAKGNQENILVKGELSADSAEITMPDQIPELINSIEITYINQHPQEPPPTAIAKQVGALPIKLDVQLNVPNQAVIAGKDFRCNWNGSVQFTGSPSQPELYGSFKLFKGEYFFRGKDFQINDGTITFAGDPEKKTTLYITATKELTDIKIDVILRGPINNPSIVFRSNPAMSQREILSWLLFNRGISDITPFQGTELNDSISDILPKEQSEPDVLQKLQNRIGIDRIDISRNEGADSNDVTVQVGKYISRGLYVHIDKSISAEANRIAIEAQLMRNFKIQADVGDNSSRQLLLKWKMNY
jgi:translocation and assembly module TamB